MCLSQCSKYKIIGSNDARDALGCILWIKVLDVNFVVGLDIEQLLVGIRCKLDNIKLLQREERARQDTRRLESTTYHILVCRYVLGYDRCKETLACTS